MRVTTEHAFRQTAGNTAQGLVLLLARIDQLEAHANSLHQERMLIHIDAQTHFQL